MENCPHFPFTAMSNVMTGRLCEMCQNSLQKSNLYTLVLTRLALDLQHMDDGAEFTLYVNWYIYAIHNRACCVSLYLTSMHRWLTVNIMQ